MQKALYFMPDISGFTNFVNSTGIEHSIHIIAELLEILLDHTTLDLKLVEIEGDALFMYTTNIPSFEAVEQQTTIMLEAFHKHILNYANMRICTCGSCKTTANLELKFLVHYGDLMNIKVKEIIKPYGSEVIKIHRLLKNSITSNEYLLFTSSVFELYRDNMDHSWQQGTEIYDLKVLEYYYKNLEEIKNKFIIAAAIGDSKKELEKKPVWGIEKTFSANIETINRYLTELKYRHIWDKNIERISFDENKINRVGTEHNCVLKLGDLKFETITTPSADGLVYGERTKDMMFTKNFSYLVKMHKIDNHTTQVQLDLYLEFSLIGTFINTQILKIVSKMWCDKLERLHQLSKNKIQS